MSYVSERKQRTQKQVDMLNEAIIELKHHCGELSMHSKTTSNGRRGKHRVITQHVIVETKHLRLDVRNAVLSTGTNDLFLVSPSNRSSYATVTVTVSYPRRPLVNTVYANAGDLNEDFTRNLIKRYDEARSDVTDDELDKTNHSWPFKVSDVASFGHVPTTYPLERDEVLHHRLSNVKTVGLVDVDPDGIVFMAKDGTIVHTPMLMFKCINSGRSTRLLLNDEDRVYGVQESYDITAVRRLEEDQTPTTHDLELLHHASCRWAEDVTTNDPSRETPDRVEPNDVMNKFIMILSELTSNPLDWVVNVRRLKNGTKHTYHRHGGGSFVVKYNKENNDITVDLRCKVDSRLWETEYTTTCEPCREIDRLHLRDLAQMSVDWTRPESCDTYEHRREFRNRYSTWNHSKIAELEPFVERLRFMHEDGTSSFTVSPYAKVFGRFRLNDDLTFDEDELGSFYFIHAHNVFYAYNPAQHGWRRVATDPGNTKRLIDTRRHEKNSMSLEDERLIQEAIALYESD